ncbi:DUF4338 domain-containing protein [Methanoregula sp.]|jgi:hypothetical protein|uniref:DUF4338 domain-containing protein n=1 Tax=Methanoregula sp. TaxID=2052170 RepID=UPI003BB14DB4
MNTLPEAPVKYCGRLFTPAELDIIRQIISRCPTRRAISIQVCAALDWVRPDGQSKEMSARVALLRMERDGLLELPAPTHSYTASRRPVFTAASDPEPEFSAPCAGIGLTLSRVATPEESILWNELVERYHYLGYQPLPGAQVRYLVRSGERLLGALGFGAAAWKVAARDSFVGWTPDERKDRLHLVVNNARFLILPWVKVKNLASRILGLAARQVAHDWPDLYGYRPVLLETFVERDRFTGTCYRAANWKRVGCTRGRGKLDCHHRHAVPVKDVYLYPLDHRFRQALTGGIH